MKPVFDQDKLNAMIKEIHAMANVEIDKEDVELWFEEAAYEDRAEQALDEFISSLRHAQKEYANDPLGRLVNGYDRLKEALHLNVISERMYHQICPLIINPDLPYTIVHKKDESDKT